MCTYLLQRHLNFTSTIHSKDMSREWCIILIRYNICRFDNSPCLWITTMGLLMLTFSFFLLTFCRVMEVTYSHSQLLLNYYILTLPILLPSCHKMMHSQDWQYNLDVVLQLFSCTSMDLTPLEYYRNISEYIYWLMEGRVQHTYQEQD